MGAPKDGSEALSLVTRRNRNRICSAPLPSFVANPCLAAVGLPRASSAMLSNSLPWLPIILPVMDDRGWWNSSITAKWNRFLSPGLACDPQIHVAHWHPDFSLQSAHRGLCHLIQKLVYRTLGGFACGGFCIAVKESQAPVL